MAARVDGCKASLIVTADEAPRGGRNTPLKANVDEACRNTPSVEKVLVCKLTGNAVTWQEGRDVWYQDAVAKRATQCEPEVMESEDPLFILYTSGSTGKPGWIFIPHTCSLSLTCHQR